MRTTIHNRTSEEIEISDRYLMDVGSDLGYPGYIKYRIQAGGKKKINSFVFLDQAKEQRKTQQILVRISGETRVLKCENFYENKEIIFEMHDSSISVKYSPRTRTTLADRIRLIVPFCRSGFHTDSPVSPQG